jgi:hypothetical protein
MNLTPTTGETSRLSNHFITTPQIERTSARIYEVIDDTRSSGKAKGLVICGPSGAGKSTMIKKIIKDRRIEITDDQDFKTIYMEIPSKPTTKSMGEAFLEALQDPFARKHGHSAEFKLLRIVGLIKTIGTELIIFDEVQHIVEYRRNTEETSKWIKYLMNHTGVAVILIGMRETQEILNNDQQLRRRFSATVDFDRFNINNSPPSHFSSLLKTLETIIKVKSISFTTNEMLQRFYYASYGLIDYLVKILDRATLLVIKNRLEGITLEVLSQAFADEVWSGAKDNRNPFSSQFNFRSLIGRHEPFYKVDNDQQ